MVLTGPLALFAAAAAALGYGAVIGGGAARVAADTAETAAESTGDGVVEGVTGLVDTQLARVERVVLGLALLVLLAFLGPITIAWLGASLLGTTRGGPRIFRDAAGVAREGIRMAGRVVGGVADAVLRLVTLGQVSLRR